MRSTIISSVFLLFLLAATARAQDPTATIVGTIPTGTVPPGGTIGTIPTGTIPPTSTVTPTATNTMTPTATPTQCVPRIAYGMPPDLLTWEPNKTIYFPGEQITFWMNPLYYISAWIVNGELFPIVFPTPTPRPPTSTPPPATPTSTPIVSTPPSDPYPAPNPTSTPIVPTPPSDPYPAPGQVLTDASLNDCSVPNQRCFAVIMPDSCQLVVEARGPGLIPRDVPSEDIVVFADITPLAPVDSAPTPEPTLPGASTQISHPTEPISVPEPLTLLLFGIGATGVVGYAMRRR
ncbi:PEP-CTERM sorting domain-containing protein [Chloroflexi bacterium TSY]|nr:PEP-CTERM sorting domain-containing protein [Chloroflexi bacterium TSY]